MNDKTPPKTNFMNVESYNKMKSNTSEESSQQSRPHKSFEYFLTTPPLSVKESMIPHLQYNELYEKATSLEEQNWALLSKLAEYESILLNLRKEQIALKEGFESKLLKEENVMEQAVQEREKCLKKLMLAQKELNDRIAACNSLNQTIVENQFKIDEQHQHICQL
jgi:hypothetical protein